MLDIWGQICLVFKSLKYPKSANLFSWKVKQLSCYFFMIYAECLLIRDRYKIQRDNILHLVVTSQQYYSVHDCANHFSYQLFPH